MIKCYNFCVYLFDMKNVECSFPSTRVHGIMFSVSSGSTESYRKHEKCHRRMKQYYPNNSFKEA